MGKRLGKIKHFGIKRLNEKERKRRKKIGLSHKTIYFSNKLKQKRAKKVFFGQKVPIPSHKKLDYF